MVRTLTRVVGIGVETADMLTYEIMLRDLRDRRAVARYAGLTGSPNESGARRRERCPAPAMPGFAAAWFSWPGASSCSRSRAPWCNGSGQEPPRFEAARASR
jgi:transposase